MIFWIEKPFKREYMDSGEEQGLRCRFPRGYPVEGKAEIKDFLSFLRKSYVFPIRLYVELKDKASFTDPSDGHKYYGIFFGGDPEQRQYPKIRVAAGIAEKNPLEDVLFALAHELTHYYQWYFLEDSSRTDRSLEREANKWAKYILELYQWEKDHEAHGRTVG